MTRQELFKHVLETYRVEPDYPWDGKEYGVMRHLRSRKWFCVVMNVGADKLGLNSEMRMDVINLKAHPAAIGSLRLQPGIFPAYHMNKAHWITVALNGYLPPEEIFSLIDESYQLTRK